MANQGDLAYLEGRVWRMKRKNEEKWRAFMESNCLPVLLLLLFVVIVVVKANTPWKPVEGERPWRRVGPKKTYFINHRQDTPSKHLAHCTKHAQTYTQTHARAHTWHPAPLIQACSFSSGALPIWGLNHQRPSHNLTSLALWPPLRPGAACFRYSSNKHLIFVSFYSAAEGMLPDSSDKGVSCSSVCFTFAFVFCF